MSKSEFECNGRVVIIAARSDPRVVIRPNWHVDWTLQTITQFASELI